MSNCEDLLWLAGWVLFFLRLGGTNSPHNAPKRPSRGNRRTAPGLRFRLSPIPQPWL